MADEAHQKAAAEQARSDHQTMYENSDQGRIRTAVGLVESVDGMQVFDLLMVAGTIIEAAVAKFDDQAALRAVVASIHHADILRVNRKQRDEKAPAPDGIVIRAPHNAWMDDPNGKPPDAAPKPVDELVEEVSEPRLGKLEGNATVIRAGQATAE